MEWIRLTSAARCAAPYCSATAEAERVFAPEAYVDANGSEQMSNVTSVPYCSRHRRIHFPSERDVSEPTP